MSSVSPCATVTAVPPFQSQPACCGGVLTDPVTSCCARRPGRYEAVPVPPPAVPVMAGRVGGGSAAALWPGAASGALSMRPDHGAELIDPVISPAGAGGLEAKGLENGLSKRLISELHPAALKATSARTMTEGRKDARNATGDGMVYPLILRRNGYE